MIHVTGNPKNKIASGVGADAGFDIDMDLSQCPYPQAIRMHQIITGKDNNAMM